MANPHRFRKIGPSAYTVTLIETGAAIGTVDRVSPDHVKTHVKWRGVTIDGVDVGSYHYSRDAAAYAIADAVFQHNAAAKYTAGRAAAVLAEPDPEYAHRGDDALRIMGARGDDAALAELDRRRAAERAAWDAQYARGNKPAETPAVEFHGREVHGEVTAGPDDLSDAVVIDDLSGAFAHLAAAPETPATRLEYLRGELRAERISYGELAELQGLTEHIDPGDVELLEAAGVPEHPDEDSERPDLPDVLWLCGNCYERTTLGLLAQCEDGCNRHLDHTGACHPREHDGETCTRCGNVDRLTPYDAENLDDDQAAELLAELSGEQAIESAGGSGWQPSTVAAADLDRLHAVADRARETGAARPTPAPDVAADGRLRVSPEVAEILRGLAADLDEAAEQARNGSGDWLGALDELGGMLSLLASGRWGAGTVAAPDDVVRELDGLGAAPDSFHDPRVECCDRDAADCDCPTRPATS